jgi:hypothetical protein
MPLFTVITSPLNNWIRCLPTSSSFGEEEVRRKRT